MIHQQHRLINIGAVFYISYLEWSVAKIAENALGTPQIAGIKCIFLENRTRPIQKNALKGANN